MTIDPIALAQALIRCPSVTPKEAGALDVIEKALAPLGFKIYRQSFSEDGTEPVDNLYARFGTESPNFCFAGHVDVVPPGDEGAWMYAPFAAEVHDGYLYGRGAEDMKSAIAAFIAAVSEQVKLPARGSISLLITCDEEGSAINGTKKMLAWLKEKGETLDACLVGEPTNPQKLGEMIKIGRRGSANFTLIVTGKQGHAAYPQLADNPVTVLVEMLQRLKTTPLDKGTAFFPPSNLEITSIDVGNAASNVIPAAAVAKFNIRFNDTYNPGTVEHWARETLDTVSKNYTLKTHVTGDAFVFPPGPLAQTIHAAVKQVTGLEPEFSTTGGTSDARYIKDYCSVAEFGTTGATAHQVNERVLLKDILALQKIYQAALAGYFTAVK